MILEDDMGLPWSRCIPPEDQRETYTTVHDFQRGRHSLTHSTMLTCPLATKDEKPGIHALYGVLFSILWRDGRRASALASAHRCH